MATSALPRSAFAAQRRALAGQCVFLLPPLPPPRPPFPAQPARSALRAMRLPTAAAAALAGPPPPAPRRHPPPARPTLPAPSGQRQRQQQAARQGRQSVENNLQLLLVLVPRARRRPACCVAWRRARRPRRGVGVLRREGSPGLALPLPRRGWRPLRSLRSPRPPVARRRRAVARAPRRYATPTGPTARPRGGPAPAASWLGRQRRPRPDCLAPQPDGTSRPLAAFGCPWPGLRAGALGVHAWRLVLSRSCSPLRRRRRRRLPGRQGGGGEPCTPGAPGPDRWRGAAGGGAVHLVGAGCLGRRRRRRPKSGQDRVRSCGLPLRCSPSLGPALPCGPGRSAAASSTAARRTRRRPALTVQCQHASCSRSRSLPQPASIRALLCASYWARRGSGSRRQALVPFQSSVSLQRQPTAACPRPPRPQSLPRPVPVGCCTPCCWMSTTVTVLVTNACLPSVCPPGCSRLRALDGDVVECPGPAAGPPAAALLAVRLPDALRVQHVAPHARRARQHQARPPAHGRRAHGPDGGGRRPQDRLGQAAREAAAQPDPHPGGADRARTLVHAPAARPRGR